MNTLSLKTGAVPNFRKTFFLCKESSLLYQTRIIKNISGMGQRFAVRLYFKPAHFDSTGYFS